MKDLKKAKSALISVFSKDGLAPIVQKLDELGITIYSTGGTEAYIKDLGINVIPVEDVTSYPSILGGRVKTLHPKVFGGILNRQDHAGDQEEMKEYEIPQIDIVIVDLYPFEKTVASGASEEDIIEKIDIGGISLIRAAAKNFKDVICVSSVKDYSDFLNLISEKNGETSLEDRRKFAARSFNVSSHYDTAIFNFFNSEEKIFKQSFTEGKELRYGENPHQKGTFFGDFDAMFDLLHGGVLISNVEIDTETAEEIHNLFCEVVIAPSYSAEALNILTAKKNRIILVQKEAALPNQLVRTCLNGLLVQDRDNKTDSLEGLSYATNNKPDPNELNDLIFASKICKHTKSNTIVLAKNKQLLASGTGQTSRVDALRHSIEKATSFNFDLKGAVMASDAFFPFPDCVEIAGNAGITAVIQPGGSIKDQLSIDYCNNNNIAMVMTGTRHFKH